MDSGKKSACAAADLTDDLIVEILSRLPPKSICRFKCVSWHWYRLITDPEHRNKIPQTLFGFFYPSFSLNHENDIVIFPDFVDVVEDEQPFSDPSLIFMAGYKSIVPDICCNGLLICSCRKASDEYDLVVCNPATEKWVVVPDSGDESIALVNHFGFDPSISPNFYVFQIIDADENYGYVGDVNIYSSETGAWSHKESGWGDELQLVDRGGVFLNGMLHLLTYNFKILTVDTEGKTWRTIHLLEPMTVKCIWKGPEAFIGQSQGRLYYINMRAGGTPKLSVWILEDYASGEWIFKYSISISQIFGEKDLMFERDYALIAIHPQCNMVFFVCRCEDKLISYDMDHVLKKFR
ncbi:unnamed protein product [Urochloa decumbens]|uniref:F-box domain-containing protein n=1 Tax=Urochloa decumbens TaxID=240449 RepID=A0ABC8XXA7_9POAL